MLASPEKFMEIVEHVKQYIPIMLNMYEKKTRGIHHLINALLIVPDEYNLEHFKTDLPKASRIVESHNKFMSANKYSFELLSASFNSNLMFKLTYFGELIETEIDDEYEFTIEVEYNGKEWSVISLD